MKWILIKKKKDEVLFIFLPKSDETWASKLQQSSRTSFYSSSRQALPKYSLQQAIYLFGNNFRV